MHYPWWHVPHMTAPMLIAFIAVIHVLVSHYAVGGGLFLAVETSHAHRTGNREYLAYLKRHTRFFVLLTVAFGAITGVGIWWTIGLASPLATEVLIRTFVFGWAIEWVFFIIEIVSAFLFYYLWGRVRPRTHMIFGWTYAISAFLSLVIINGILAFMLNPGRWPETQAFWHGFFNPQYLPQLLARTGGCLLLASLYVYFHASIWADRDLRALIAKRSSRPALLGSALILISGPLFFATLPESAALNLEKAAALNIFAGLLFAITAVVMVMLYLGPARNPQWLTPGFGILFLCFGLAAVTVGEFIREAVRKPYVVYNVVLSSGVMAEDVPALRAAGLLESGVYTRAALQSLAPDAIAEDGTVDEAALVANSDDETRVALGELLAVNTCNQCHALESGMSSLASLTAGWTPEMLEAVALQPERHQVAMPPWAGTREEAALLAEFLASIQRGQPEGMYFGEEPGNGAAEAAREVVQ